MRGYLPLFAVVAAAAACSSSPEAPSPVLGSSQQEIIGGKASTDDQNAVVLLVHTDRKSSFGACTGALIAPNLVLTARHCVSQTNDAPFACDEKGEAYGDGGTAGGTLKPSEFYVFMGTERPVFGRQPEPAGRGQKVFHDGAKVLCGHDLAVIRLEKDIENAPILPLRLETAPEAGETFTAIGWGVTRSSPFPAVRQQRAGIEIEKVGPSKGTATDGPLPPNDFRVGEAICSGDSGGPGISESTGAILGVVSRGGNGEFNENNPAAGCTGEATKNEYTAVAPFKDLIIAAFEEAGHEPWIEGQPDPRLLKFDDACEAAEACRSGVCVAGKCTQSCNDASECPSGNECKTTAQGKVCQAPAAAATTTTTSSGCAASAAGSNGAFAPWMLAGLAALVARRRRRHA